MPQLEDLTGQHFGKLIAIKHIGRTHDRSTLWLCKCDCGKEHIVRAATLKNGGTKSCGCYKPPLSPYGHGGVMNFRSEYWAWQNMRGRCYDPKDKSWPYYGERGITVCERWMKFGNFLADMGPKPTPKHSIDRIDNNGNYEPGNCRWATRIVQCNNRRTNTFLSYNGKR